MMIAIFAHVVKVLKNSALAHSEEDLRLHYACLQHGYTAPISSLPVTVFRNGAPFAN